MKDLTLTIQRKTLVPTKYQMNHKYRSDWVSVAKLTPEDTAKLFSHYGIGGKISRESQFAKLIKDNFGPGIYHVKAFKKGRKGFYAFLKIECKETTFARLPRRLTSTQKEKLKQIQQYKFLKKQIVNVIDHEERDNIKREMIELEEELDLNREIIELESGKCGPTPYLKPSVPVFKEHLYDDYNQFYRNEIMEATKYDTDTMIEIKSPTGNTSLC